MPANHSITNVLSPNLKTGPRYGFCYTSFPYTAVAITPDFLTYSVDLFLFKINEIIRVSETYSINCLTEFYTVNSTFFC